MLSLLELKPRSFLIRLNQLNQLQTKFHCKLQMQMQKLQSSRRSQYDIMAVKMSILFVNTIYLTQEIHVNASLFLALRIMK